MNKLKSIIFLAAALLIADTIQAKVLMQFPFAGVTVELLDSASAAAENSKPDEYTKAHTQFDRQIRLGKADAIEQDYLALAANQVRSWPENEQQAIKKAFGEIDSFLKANHITLNLPSKILVIKTAGKEEFEADGYTRGNRIMLCTRPRQPLDEHLVAHELFHVYSRYNEKRRDNIYAIFGFERCKRINTAAAMKGRVITNPDCPFIEHFINLKNGDKNMDMVLQLYSKNDYKPEYTLGDYTNVGLLQVEGAGMIKRPVMKDGAGVVYDLGQVPDLFRRISGNTSYVLHPEEIAAEHFSMWVISQKVPQPEFFDKLKVALQ